LYSCCSDRAEIQPKFNMHVGRNPLLAAICRDVLGPSVNEVCQFSLKLLAAVSGNPCVVSEYLGELAGGECNISYVWNYRGFHQT
jgi:hypothetical protein